ncbi:hypothetical protein [Sporosarcina pasteurii]|uniref:Uncharacterized protein n=1 Tax=Sporosarcina pasteurii TaxID=1474 RepID=A0A380BBL2_SPOPA|nr:hypothetical protein [Sporosarcina pasteurii]MDS9472883.1 hypothetical protein [Sporosarcina pasteurii]QBQ06431.1 hypothetical protein E2C16_12460 [Sporosarcina pasteurii]SUI98514.1 Uncharacterised protein [Sporosarcina pasteurii]
MIQSLRIVEDVLENSSHQRWHFEVILDDKKYEGYYKDDDVDWFQMQPDQDNHAMPLEQLEDEVKRRINEWLSTLQ